MSVARAFSPPRRWTGLPAATPARRRVPRQRSDCRPTPGFLRRGTASWRTRPRRSPGRNVGRAGGEPSAQPISNPVSVSRTCSKAVDSNIEGSKVAGRPRGDAIVEPRLMPGVVHAEGVTHTLWPCAVDVSRRTARRAGARDIRGSLSGIKKDSAEDASPMLVG